LIASTPRNILIIRLSAIGDIIMASALLPALREAWPEAKLSWLTDESNAALLQGNPRLDDVILWPRRRWRGLRQARRYGELFGEFRALAGRLRQARFDLVLDLQGLLKSGLWAWLSGSQVRIGLGSREGSQWLMTKTLDTRTETPRIGGEYLKLARALGLAPAHFDMDIQPTAQTRAQARALLADAGVDGPFAVLCPFTTRPQKHWFEARWAELARRLAAEWGWRSLVLGGPDDRDGAARIAQAAPGLASLAGRTGLAECAAIIGEAGLVVGVDTGLTHLGTAMRTPTLALFGSTRPYLDAATPRSKVLYEALPCSPCKRHPSCDGRFDCMKQHTVEKILAEAKKLLETET
jgi:heptosyltransferase-1